MLSQAGLISWLREGRLGYILSTSPVYFSSLLCLIYLLYIGSACLRTVILWRLSLNWTQLIVPFPHLQNRVCSFSGLLDYLPYHDMLRKESPAHLVDVGPNLCAHIPLTGHSHHNLLAQLQQAQRTISREISLLG